MLLIIIDLVKVEKLVKYTKDSNIQSLSILSDYPTSYRSIAYTEGNANVLD